MVTLKIWRDETTTTPEIREEVPYGLAVAYGLHGGFYKVQAVDPSCEVIFTEWKQPLN